MDFGPCLREMHQSLWYSTSTGPSWVYIKLFENMLNLGLACFDLTLENYKWTCYLSLVNLFDNMVTW